ncbi:ABC-2 type transport system ATP-binding protein [Ruminococcus sp. YE71]|uniref:ABC transporter ATP-binding protein n=1 Tax=unclassified Ruminococcus TaxID=2608920 RepID=UPI0008852752|nr:MULTISPECIES: ABC transporter ATP-binding protein [unclassified Ruminococcus]SDA25055.1 ABC-2 type transport system ATP-binding protein [Ruminococcus sp. YE78]SFW43081.1 ABC-2 type transport system ATP-binding protein [Ruminococcus sp. YE71]
MENILEINGLNKSYEGFSLRDVSFSLPRGYIMGFVGQNGSGKTTTIRSILNMAKTDSGKISVFGLDSVEDSVEIKERLGVVFDSLYLGEHLNISRIERQLKPFYKNWDSDCFAKLIKRFGLPDNKKVGDFSKGMKMKVMIAVALAHKPDFIILDEPTSGLDPVARDELLDILAEFIEDENRGVLFSTHITADVERIADYVTILNNGRVWFTGTKDDLTEKFAVLKGDPDDIPDSVKPKLIGYHKYRNGFDALIDRTELKTLPDTLEYEKATIDEILVYIAKEDKNETDS